jgi:hypothetical protein
VLHSPISAALPKHIWRFRRRASFHHGFLICTVALVAGFASLAPRPSPQSDPQVESVQEIVANLDAGRAVIGVAKDGIVIATLENPIEPATRPPVIVELAGERIAVLFGAVDWWLPEEHRELSRIEAELPSLPTAEGASSPLLRADSESSGEAMDIERIAKRLHSRLNWIAGHIHGNLHLAEDEPVAEMLLADYAHDYGPEVWLIQYSFEQEPQQGDFWQTRALQPRYTQLWPPEKGQPRGLVEIGYPSDAAAPAIEQLLRSEDPRIDRALGGSPDLQRASEAVLNGEVGKLTAVDVAALLRATLGAIATPNARMVEAEINKDQGVGWFIRPPALPALPGAEQPHPPGAPSLVRPPGKPGGPG